MQSKFGLLAGRASFALLIAASAAHALPAGPDGHAPNLPTPENTDVELTDRQAIPRITWKMAHDVPVWKTITLGSYADPNALREALESDTCGRLTTAANAPVLPAAMGAPHAPHCRLGNDAAEIIGRPAFHLSRTRQALDLVVVSLAELGFPAGENVAIEDIYARADMLGYALCPAEAAAQLRLSYLDQPAREFLHVAMNPISTHAGEPIDLTLGNDGASLLVLGGDARPNVALDVDTRLVFVRPRPAR